ncbi:unnamed protein product [Sphagnum balticum]
MPAKLLPAALLQADNVPIGGGDGAESKFGSKMHSMATKRMTTDGVAKRQSAMKKKHQKKRKESFGTYIFKGSSRKNFISNTFSTCFCSATHRTSGRYDDESIDINHEQLPDRHARSYGIPSRAVGFAQCTLDRIQSYLGGIALSFSCGRFL